MFRFCLTIIFASSLQPAAGSITWSKQVAPILFAHCAGCHRPGQAVPFSLLSYEDARKRARLIQEVTTQRYMPPWKPQPGYGNFQGANRLSTQEINTLARWAEAAAPEGNPKVAPQPPEYPAGWQLGVPDAVIEFPHPVEANADGPDQYRCFVLPKQFAGDRYVRAFEFNPNGASVLHHALIFVDTRMKVASHEPYDCFGTPGFLPSAALGGWSPGARAVTMPPGTAVHVPSGARFVIQLHLHPTGRREHVNPKVALYFADRPPKRVLMDVALGSNRIDIPAQDQSFQVADQFVLPVPVEVTGVIPHAHYLCKDMKAWAILPNGAKRWLLWIRDWDFNAQAQYSYKRPVDLPADTTIHMQFTYDNSDANPRNPNHPAQRVVWGAGSTDEMAGLHLQVIPRNESDMHELGMAMWGKLMRGVGGRFYRPPTPSE